MKCGGLVVTSMRAAMLSVEMLSAADVRGSVRIGAASERLALHNQPQG